ncbi:hypothetical protein [Mucilaginibacter sp. HD30]
MKKLDLSEFSIKVPRNWSYKKQRGEDSFIGEIVGPKVDLSFDCSDRGYANHLDEADDKYHVIKVDTTQGYIIKLIYPKVTGRGITGIYAHTRSSYFNFQMHV